MQDLEWHREATGSYITGDNGLRGQDASEFFARVNRESGHWHVTTYTFGLVLTSVQARTLALGKALAETTYFHVEGAS